VTTAIEYCADLVRESDEDRFASASFAPSGSRESLVVLYAFNIEVSKTRDSVSEPMLGEIRLQWWREAIAEIYDDTPRQHLVVEALKDVVETSGLPRGPFETLIDARAMDLESMPFESMGSLEDYLKATSSGLMAQALAILDEGGEGKGDTHDTFVSEAGRAWALAGMLRALPFRAAQGQCIIPRDLITKHDLDVDALLAGQMHAGLRRCLDDLSDLSDTAYRMCRETAKDVPSNLWPAFLHVGLVPGYLRACREDNFLEVASSIPLWRRQLRLLRCMTFGRL